jgi:hypothetical protein
MTEKSIGLRALETGSGCRPASEAEKYPEARRRELIGERRAVPDLWAGTFQVSQLVKHLMTYCQIRHHTQTIQGLLASGAATAEQAATLRDAGTRVSPERIVKALQELAAWTRRNTDTRVMKVR